ncbi:HD domain-containing phosphohydrolase [Proteinivorax tanatarense]|uniref:HD domain-containing phosphohydrolase n=1 Tax=Proteinivorax tanatarense TaxID=1260629 RepID=A0AAU7VIC5_9FIRM
MEIDVIALVSSFSMALDLAENKHLSHAKRTGYIAVKIGERLGVNYKDLTDLYVASLLHDIGVTRTLSQAHFQKERVKNHCIFGTELVRELPFYSHLDKTILYHHEHWDGSGPHFIAGDKIPLYSQIIFVADQLEIQYIASASIEKNKSLFKDYVNKRQGVQFSPKVVEALNFLMETEAFWFDLKQPNIENSLPYIYKSSANTKTMDMESLLKVGSVFSRLIDSKSEFTKRHSQGLADVMVKIAKKNNYSCETTNKVKLAALLHDLGKLKLAMTY